MKNLEWYVFIEDFNNRTVKKFNIFSHCVFMKDVNKAMKLHKNDFEAFKKAIDSSLRYNFWSRCEYEIILTGWPTCFVTDCIESIHSEPSGRLTGVELEISEKVDIYDQVMLNWSQFISYLWGNTQPCENIKTKSKPTDTTWQQLSIFDLLDEQEGKKAGV